MPLSLKEKTIFADGINHYFPAHFIKKYLVEAYVLMLDQKPEAKEAIAEYFALRMTRSIQFESLNQFFDLAEIDRKIKDKLPGLFEFFKRSLLHNKKYSKEKLRSWVEKIKKMNPILSNADISTYWFMGEHYLEGQISSLNIVNRSIVKNNRRDFFFGENTEGRVRREWPFYKYALNNHNLLKNILLGMGIEAILFGPYRVTLCTIIFFALTTIYDLYHAGSKTIVCLRNGLGAMFEINISTLEKDNAQQEHIQEKQKQLQNAMSESLENSEYEAKSEQKLNEDPIIVLQPVADDAEVKTQESKSKRQKIDSNEHEQKNLEIKENKGYFPAENTVLAKTFGEEFADKPIVKLQGSYLSENSSLYAIWAVDEDHLTKQDDQELKGLRDIFSEGTLVPPVGKRGIKYMPNLNFHEIKGSTLARVLGEKRMTIGNKTAIIFTSFFPEGIHKSRHRNTLFSNTAYQSTRLEDVQQKTRTTSYR